MRAVLVPRRAALSPGVGMTGSQPDGTEQVCSMTLPPPGEVDGVWGGCKERRGGDVRKMAEPVESQAFRLELQSLWNILTS